MIPRVNRGEVAKLVVHIYDIGLDNSRGVLIDPSTSITVQINDPNGNEILAASAMVFSSTGIYYYNFATLSTYLLGRYNVTFTAVDDTFTTLQKFSFEIIR